MENNQNDNKPSNQYPAPPMPFPMLPLHPAPFTMQRAAYNTSYDPNNAYYQFGDIDINKSFNVQRQRGNHIDQFNRKRQREDDRSDIHHNKKRKLDSAQTMPLINNNSYYTTPNEKQYTELASFLKKINMINYMDVMVAEGWHTNDDLLNLDNDELVRLNIGGGYRKRILKGLQRYIIGNKAEDNHPTKDTTDQRENSDDHDPDDGDSDYSLLSKEYEETDDDTDAVEIKKGKNSKTSNGWDGTNVYEMTGDNIKKLLIIRGANIKQTKKRDDLISDLVKMKLNGVDYSTLTQKQLKCECRLRGLKVGGNKGDLLKRLKSY